MNPSVRWTDGIRRLDAGCSILLSNPSISANTFNPGILLEYQDLTFSIFNSDSEYFKDCVFPYCNPYAFTDLINCLIHSNLLHFDDSEP